MSLPLMSSITMINLSLVLAVAHAPLAMDISAAYVELFHSIEISINSPITCGLKADY